MKRIENYLNILHFCFYRLHYKLHLFANKINPFNLIHKLPFQKRRYEELGIDIHKEIDKALRDSVYVGGAMLFGTFPNIIFNNPYNPYSPFRP